MKHVFKKHILCALVLVSSSAFAVLADHHREKCCPEQLQPQCNPCKSDEKHCCNKNVNIFSRRIGKLYHVNGILPTVDNTPINPNPNPQIIERCFMRYIYVADNNSTTTPPAQPLYCAIDDSAVDSAGDLITPGTYNVFNAVTIAPGPRTLLGQVTITRDAQGFIFIQQTLVNPAPLPALLNYPNEFCRTFQSLLRIEMYYHLIADGKNETSYLATAITKPGERDVAPGQTLPDVFPACASATCQKSDLIKTSPAMLVACPTGRRRDLMHTQTFALYTTCSSGIPNADEAVNDAPGSGAFNDLTQDFYSTNIWQNCNTNDPLDFLNRGYFSSFESLPSYTYNSLDRIPAIEAQMDYIISLWDIASHASNNAKATFQHKYYNGGSGGAAPSAFLEQTKYKFNLALFNSAFTHLLATEYNIIDAAFMYEWNKQINPVQFSDQQLAVLLGLTTQQVPNPANTSLYAPTVADLYVSVGATNDKPLGWAPSGVFARNPNDLINSVLRGNYDANQLVVQPDGTVIPAWFDNIGIVYGNGLVNDNFLPVGTKIVNYYATPDPVSGQYPFTVVQPGECVHGYLLPPAKLSEPTIPANAIAQQRKLGYRALVDLDIQKINAPYSYVIVNPPAAPFSKLAPGSGIRRSEAEALAIKFAVANRNYRLDGKSRIPHLNLSVSIGTLFDQGRIHPPSNQNETFSSIDINNKLSKRKHKKLFVQTSNLPFGGPPINDVNDVPDSYVGKRAKDLLDSNLLCPDGNMTLPKSVGSNFIPTGTVSVTDLASQSGMSPDEVIAFKYAIAAESFNVQCVTEQVAEMPFLTFAGYLFSLTNPTTQSTLQGSDGNEKKLCSVQERLLSIINRLNDQGKFCKPIKDRNGKKIKIDGKEVKLTPKFDNQLAVLNNGKPNPVITKMLTNYY